MKSSNSVLDFVIRGIDHVVHFFASSFSHRESALAGGIDVSPGLTVAGIGMCIEKLGILGIYNDAIGSYLLVQIVQEGINVFLEMVVNQFLGSF